jgi:ArsR family transcriptional regulator
VDRSSADILFKSFGDDARRQIARILAETPLTVGEIADVLGLPQSTVSRHLKSLRATGLLVERREGSRVYVALGEPSGNGANRVPGSLEQLLNLWLRHQPISPAVAARLGRALDERNGSEDTFDRLAHQWDDLRFEYFGGAFHLEALASLLPGEWRVLDAGTGTGYLLPFLGRHFREVVAADRSPAMLDLARQRAMKAGLGNVDFRLGRLEALPIEDASIDCAISMLVLRHSPDLGRALGELSRVLVDLGRLLVVDIGPHSMEEFRRRIGDASLGLDPATVAQALDEAGMDVACRRVLSPREATPAGPKRPAPELYLISARRRVRTGAPKTGIDEDCSSSRTTPHHHQRRSHEYDREDGL